jgi:hypothetical protein
MNKFNITAVLDTGRPARGTVLIDRNAGLFHVRPYKRRRVYTLPLSDVASIIVSRIIKAEVAEKRRAKLAKRG